MMMIFKFSKSSFVFISTLIVIQICLCSGYLNVSDSIGSRVNDFTTPFSTNNTFLATISTTDTLASMSVNGVTILNLKAGSPRHEVNRSARRVQIKFAPKRTINPSRKASSQRTQATISQVSYELLQGNQVEMNSSQVVNVTASKNFPSSTYAPTNNTESQNITRSVTTIANPYMDYDNLNSTQSTRNPVTSTTFIATQRLFISEKRTTPEVEQITSSSVIPRTQTTPIIFSTSTSIPQIPPTTPESPLKKSKSISKPTPETPVQHEGVEPKSQPSYANVQVLPISLDDNLLPFPRPYPYQALYSHLDSRYENSNRMEENYQSRLTDSEKLAHEILNSKPAVKKEMAKKILELFLQNQANQKHRLMQVTPTPTLL